MCWYFVPSACLFMLDQDENQLCQVDNLSQDYKKIFTKLASQKLKGRLLTVLPKNIYRMTKATYLSMRRVQFVTRNSEFTTDIYFYVYAPTHRAGLKMYFYKLQNIPQSESIYYHTCHILLNMFQTTVQTNK